MRIVISYHSLPVQLTDMLSYNQQGVSDANIGMPVNAFGQQWVTAKPNWVANQSPHFSNRIGYWTPPTNSQSPPPQAQAQARQWSNQFPSQYQQKYNFVPANSQVIPSPMQINQHIQPHQHSTPVKSHQARITLVPNASGGFKAIVKRKRKRTHFTTEQIEAMESVFQKKPYVTREDRQVIVQQLQLNDTAVKVWFQNRRLRGKRAAEEAAAEQAMYEEEIGSDQSFYNCADVTHKDTTEYQRPAKMSRLDLLESELSQKVDESGYITLDEKSISDIVTAIDNALSSDINLDFELSNPSEDENLKAVTNRWHSDKLSNTSSENLDTVELLSNEERAVNTLSGSSSPEKQEVEDLQVNEVSTCESSDPVVNDVEETEGSTSAASSYEPISPAESPASDITNEDNLRWEQFAPEQSLQQLFDLHFC